MDYNHLLEASFSVIGVLFTFAKIVGVIKAIIFAEHVVSPYMRKMLVNQRAEYINAHVMESHQESLKTCMTNQCASLG